MTFSGASPARSAVAHSHSNFAHLLDSSVIPPFLESSYAPEFDSGSDILVLEPLLLFQQFTLVPVFYQLNRDLQRQFEKCLSSLQHSKFTGRSHDLPFVQFLTNWLLLINDHQDDTRDLLGLLRRALHQDVLKCISVSFDFTSQHFLDLVPVLYRRYCAPHRHTLACNSYMPLVWARCPSMSWQLNFILYGLKLLASFLMKSYVLNGYRLSVLSGRNPCFFTFTSALISSVW